MCFLRLLRILKNTVSHTNNNTGRLFCIMVLLMHLSNPVILFMEKELILLIKLLNCFRQKKRGSPNWLRKLRRISMQLIKRNLLLLCPQGIIIGLLKPVKMVLCSVRRSHLLNTQLKKLCSHLMQRGIQKRIVLGTSNHMETLKLVNRKIAIINGT